MAVNYQCTFDLDKCIKTLGLDERGRVQQKVTNEILDLSEPYVPFETGALSDSGEVVNDTTVVWGDKDDMEYAQYMWNGIVYEDPELHCAGFKTENGWRSRKDVEKVPTTRSLEYHGGSLRSSHWVDKMFQNGGREKVEKAAREAARK